MTDSVAPSGQNETFDFGTNVGQLLDLVTHSLYGNSEVFLRELISNSSDALDKLRYLALNDSALYEEDSDLKIQVKVDSKLKTITVSDNGIGMSREEVIEHLGTIAQSGTKSFLSGLSGDQAKDSELIGQFGVGFYSAYIVADKVIVRTRRAGMNPDQGVEWESDGRGQFTVKNLLLPQRGTEIVLFLKEDEKEFLEDYRLRQIITKYSDHIMAPIEMPKIESAESKKDEEGKTDDAKKEDAKQDDKQDPEWSRVNQAKALWTLAKSEIKDEDYKEFYKHISHDYEDPCNWALNRVEGSVEYTSLLYVPQRAPADMWNRDMARGLKLYVRKVFIMDDAEQLLPFYMRFVRGVVDTNDLPLNVSREILQNNKIIARIRSGCTKRVLSMLEDMAKNDVEKYQKFWKVFGQVLKEGPAEDFANRERIAKLLRFNSTFEDSDGENISLTSYLERMKEDQKKIYYLTADSYAAAKGSPLLEAFRKRDVEVLLLVDRVDEWLLSHLSEFDGKPLQSIAKGELDMEELGGNKVDEKDRKAQEQNFKSVLEKITKYLGDNRVKQVRLTDRLTDSPACVVYDAQDAGGHLQRLMAAAGQDAPQSVPILELNPTHPLVEKLNVVADDSELSRWSEVLLGQALLAEGEQLKDPQQFIRELNDLLGKSS